MDEEQLTELSAFVDATGTKLGAAYAKHAGIVAAPGPFIQLLLQILTMFLGTCPIPIAASIKQKTAAPSLLDRLRLRATINRAVRQNPDIHLNAAAAQAAILDVGVTATEGDITNMLTVAQMTN